MTKKKSESLTKAQLEAISRAEAELKAFKKAKAAKIVFCNIAWMNHYHGITEHDKPKNGGSFVTETGDAWESLNFFPRNHVCYGYVQHRGNNLDLARVERGTEGADAIHDVTVVWVATGESGRQAGDRGWQTEMGGGHRGRAGPRMPGTRTAAQGQGRGIGQADC